MWHLEESRATSELDSVEEGIGPCGGNGMHILKEAEDVGFQELQGVTWAAMEVRQEKGDPDERGPQAQNKGHLGARKGMTGTLSEV